MHGRGFRQKWATGTNAQLRDTVVVLLRETRKQNITVMWK